MFDILKYVESSDIKLPPGFWINIYTTGNTQILQFTPSASVSKFNQTMSINPNLFDTISTGDVIAVCVILLDDGKYYISDYTDNVAIEKFMQIIEKAINDE